MLGDKKCVNTMRKINVHFICYEQMFKSLAGIYSKIELPFESKSTTKRQNAGLCDEIESVLVENNLVFVSHVYS